MVATTAFIAVTVVVDAPAGQATGETGGWMDHMLSGSWGSGMFWILFWAGLLVLVTAVTLWLMDERVSRVRQAEEDALETLERPDARGEIDSRGFREKKRSLV